MMTDKQIIEQIRDYLDKELVPETEIDLMSDDTGDIIRGRKELAISLIDKINEMNKTAFKRGKKACSYCSYIQTWDEMKGLRNE
jgi:hypothetical protein|tara:strand:+ start:608 stop:859 length:252 start_codon:yes stop_codon:yes gene_type:complete